jgi:enoyl-CoA hydratase
MVGMGRALDMILTGRPVKAEEALSMGLANRLVPAGQALEAARALAQQLAAFPQQCMRADRASAYAQWDMTLADALRSEGRKGAPVVAAEELTALRTSLGARDVMGSFAVIADKA